MKENNKKNCETATKKNMAEIDYSAFEMCMACYNTKNNKHLGGCDNTHHISKIIFMFTHKLL